MSDLIECCVERTEKLPLERTFAALGLALGSEDGTARLALDPEATAAAVSRRSRWTIE